MAEAELILKSLDPSKATGHDQIPADGAHGCGVLVAYTA